MAWAAMTALRELTARRRGGKDQVLCGRTQVSATAADQVAMELRQSWQSVGGEIAYGCARGGRPGVGARAADWGAMERGEWGQPVAGRPAPPGEVAPRLPRTFAALAA